LGNGEYLALPTAIRGDRGGREKVSRSDAATRIGRIGKNAITHGCEWNHCFNVRMI